MYVFYLSTCLSLLPVGFLFDRLSVCLSVRPSVCQSIHLAVWPYLFLSDLFFALINLCGWLVFNNQIFIGFIYLFINWLINVFIIYSFILLFIYFTYLLTYM